MILNFFSFYPRNFDSSIAHLLRSETDFLLAVCKSSSYSSNTEFLIIGLKQQLSKIDNSSLNTTHSARRARNIGFIFNIMPKM